MISICNGIRRLDERRKIRLSRIATLFWALLLFGLAVLSLHKVGRVIEVGLQIASVAYGALLGVFLLGVLTRRANQSGAMVGMLFGFVTELYIWLVHARCRGPGMWRLGRWSRSAVGYAVSLSRRRKAFNRKGRKGDRKGRKGNHLEVPFWAFF